MKSNFLIKVILFLILSFSLTCVNAQRHKHHNIPKHHYPHYKYKKMPNWGYSYKVAPRNAYIVPHSGARYHYHSGIFYKQYGPKYVIVRAPIGVRVRTLPAGNIRFVNRGRTFFYYYGTFYVRSVDNNEYITVAPPLGARIDALPNGYIKVIIDERTYYEFEGTLYKAVVDNYGEVWYEVVKEW